MTTYYVDPLANAAWQAAHSYAVGNIVTPVIDGGADNKYVYECTDAGTSGGSEPSWDATVGNNTVEDTADDVTWICRAPDSWGKALSTIQAAFDLAVAGDIVYCKGAGASVAQTIAATIDVDTNAGTNAAGFIKIIGTNAAGAVDGSRYIIDANDGSYHAMTFTNTADMYWLENIQVQNTHSGTYHGFYSSAANNDGMVMINCCATDCGGSGYYIDRFRYGLLHRCVSYLNSANGFYLSASQMTLVLCCARNNSTDGFSAHTTGSMIGCIAHENSSDGIYPGWGGYPLIMNCAIDLNAATGILYQAHTGLGAFPVILANRITNHSGDGDIGLNTSGEVVVYGYNAFDTNKDHFSDSASLSQFIPNVGAATDSNDYNNEDSAGGGDTNQGYVSVASGSENLSTHYVDATNPDMRRVAVTVPWT